MTQKCRTNLILTVLGAAMLLQTVSATKVEFEAGGWYRVPADIKRKDVKETLTNSQTEAEYPRKNDNETKFLKGIFYVVNVMSSSKDGIVMQIVYHKKDKVLRITATEKKVLEKKCEDVLAPDTMKKILNKAETHSTLAEYITKHNKNGTAAFPKNTEWEACSNLANFLQSEHGETVRQHFIHATDKHLEILSSFLKFVQVNEHRVPETAFTKETDNEQWEACNSLVKFLKNPVNSNAFTKDTQWKACKTLLEFKAKGKNSEFGIGDWITASGNSGKIFGGTDYYSKNDTGKIVDIEVTKPGSDKFNLVVAWARNQGVYLKGKKSLPKKKWGRLNKIEAHKASEYQKTYNAYQNQSGSHRRLHSMSRLLRDIERAQRTA